MMLCAAILSAQTPAKQKADKQQPTDAKGKEDAKPKPSGPPPEWQVYYKANGITDPQKKLEALEKVLKDFPKAEGFFRFQVNQSILSTMIKALPDQKERILAHARTWADKASAEHRNNVLNTIATTLLDAGIMLDEAQSFVEKGLAELDEKKYVENRKKSMAEAKMPVPSDEELAKSFRSTRAGSLSVLGRIQFKKGNSAEAEKYLKESYDANPTITATAVTLAEISEKSGDEKTALHYLSVAILSGRVKKEDRERFENLYRKTHNNSLDGMEAMLDERYKQVFPPPIHVDDYQPTELRSKRVVLAEVFTGSGCPPCVAADLAFDAVMERYSRDEVAVLMYHQHIPSPDPMTNKATQKRYNFYGGGGVPVFIIDGKKDGGGGPRDSTRVFYNRVNPVIEKELEVAAEANIKLNAVMDGSTVKIRAEVENIKGVEGPIRLQVALAEDLLRYSGENGIRFHPMVVRALAGHDSGGFVVEATSPAAFEHAFDISKIVGEIKTHLDEFETNRNKDLPADSKSKFAFAEKKHEIDSGKLSVVAFIQDEKTKKILQAVYIKPKAGESSASK